MLTAFLLLLVLRLSRCTADENYETKTVSMKDGVTLSCPRDTSWLETNLFWFRMVSGGTPEFLGGTPSFDYEEVTETSHFTVKQEPEKFVLTIKETRLNDTGLYFCVKLCQLNVTFLKRTFLRIKGPDITAIAQDISPDPEDSKTLQCSVLRDKSSKTCPDKPRVFWFRSGSDDSRPSVIYTHGNKSDGCEESPETPSLQRCVYSFSKTVSSSDDGTYYCAVVACGEILIGNGTKLTSEGNNMQHSKTNIALYLLSAALVLCLFVIVFLVCTIRTISCNAAVDPCGNAATSSTDQQSLQRDESSLVYAAPAFSKKRKTDKGPRRNVKPAEDQIIYSGVRTAATD
ncbi:signal-regulatory protein beta-2-like [Xyrichtys novacula]|uniref:Signal-regulatory protein beta-2-like n=1 Tax=Xyrichtys novacula TaxID=13765 RepID=A0AAV1FE61_XYRNO|nr:signal-regulatory protein beta-2-like [Xyrichtys novacula]